MRLTAPRVAPLQDSELTDEQREALATPVTDRRPAINTSTAPWRTPRRR